MLRYLLFNLVLFGSLAFILYQVFKFTFGLGAGKGQLRRDANKLKEELKVYLGKLVPITPQELDLFSLNQTDQTVKRGMNRITRGVFTSIYYEPLLAYAYKEYRGGKMSLLIAKTESDEYIYLSREGVTEVTFNGSEIGVIHADGRMTNKSGNQLLGYIAMDDLLSSHPVTIEGREVGNVINPRMAIADNPRAFEMLERMNDREKSIFMSMTILSLIEESIT